jgi:high-affinity iron transporter
MLPVFLLSLREGIEAALILGIVLGALQKLRRPDLKASVWLGALLALVASLAVAVLLTGLGMSLEDPGEAIFEGLTMLLAAGILTWMIFWMSRQSRSIKGELEVGVGKAVATAGKGALFGLAFVAVLREGIELALFVTAAFFVEQGVNGTTTTVQTLAGALLGLFTAGLLGWSLFASTVRLDLRRFFQVTGFLLILFAAGLVAHGIHEFIEVGWIPAVVERVWDLNAVVSETSLPGELLKTLFGYNPTPSLVEVLAYAAYFGAIFAGLRWSAHRQEREIRQSA